MNLRSENSHPTESRSITRGVAGGLTNSLDLLREHANADIVATNLRDDVRCDIDAYIFQDGDITNAHVHQPYLTYLVQLVSWSYRHGQR